MSVIIGKLGHLLLEFEKGFLHLIAGKKVM